MERSRKTRRIVTVIAALLILIVTTLGGTLAYQDYKQHKSNEFNGDTIKFEARLVEDFDEVNDWKINDGPVTKKISVVNLGQAPEYGDVYVRIQLKEYMEIGALSYDETNERYMIDTRGEFIIYDTVDDAIAATAVGGVYAGHNYKNLTDAVTGKSGYFIETRDHDPNGQMGKHVITSFMVSDATAVIKNGPQQKASGTNHHEFQSEECDYAIHSWKPGSVLETRDYIEWQLNTGAIITLSEWLDPAGIYKGMPIDKWVIDDTNDEGWVYWGRALEPGSGTALFMESVTLIQQPEGSLYYVIHTDMQAVSLDELISGNVDWGEAGDALINIIKPDDDITEDDSLPIKTAPADGFSPIRDINSPMNGDGLYVKIFYPDLTHPNNNVYYHDGSIHLEDIIADGNYSGITAKAVDAKYKDYISVGVDHHGKPSIIYSYVPTNQELLDWAMSHGPMEDIFMQTQVEISRADGKTAVITINMFYWNSSMTFE